MTALQEIINKIENILIASDALEVNLNGIDEEQLINKIKEYFTDKEEKILNKEILIKIVNEIKESNEKKVVVLHTNYKEAKDIDAKFEIKNIYPEKTSSSTEDFLKYFNNRFDKIKRLIERRVNFIKDISSLKNYTNGREVAIVGLVYDKITTKKGHILVTIDDPTGVAKVLFIKSDDPNLSKLYDSATKIVKDEVIAIKGKISNSLIIANEIVYPEIPIKSITPSNEDISIVFTSDIHIGSKLFLKDEFEKFIEWLKSDDKSARKVKYIILGGDVVDGIGVYPEQQKELEVKDIFKQYEILKNYLEELPDYMHIFVAPGNHDAVTLAEPQPPIPNDLFKEIKNSNIHLLSNPAYVTLNGLKVLVYHGASLDPIIRDIPGCSYERPTTAMIELLKRRHLSPIYGGNEILPTREDKLVIEDIPDIVHMGHVHKNDYAIYHGVLFINSGTWQSRTIYQMKLGHLPTPGRVPIYNMHTSQLYTMKFSDLSYD